MVDQFRECQRELLRLQRGVITRRQALAVGLTEKAITVRLRSERWQRLHPGVYATFSGEIPREAEIWAAVLRAGPAAVLSHDTAAELHGLLDSPARLMHVTVPHGSRVARPDGVAVHYSRRIAQSRHPTLRPPRTRIDDTVLDLAETADMLDDAVALIVRAIGRRRTTADRLAAAIEQRPRMRWRADMEQVLGAAAEGAHSLLEYRYVTRVERPHGLPHGKRQRRVERRGASQYQDVAYEGYLLVVELDGKAAHPLESRWRDISRDNANLALGVVTVRLGYVDVSVRPCATANLLGRALQHRGWRGRPRRCGPACEVADQ